MIVPKDDAKKDRAVALKPGRDIKPADATDNNATSLQVHLASEVGRTLCLPAGLSKDEKLERMKSAMVMFREIRPQGNLEGMLAAQMVAAHSTAMEFLRRAMHEEQSLVGQTQNLNHAMKLMSMYTRQLEVLDKHRGKGQQKVTVEYVNVEAGGQAIVGQVEAGRGPKRKRRKGPATPAMTPAIDHAPEVPLEIPDPVVRQRTPQKVPQKVRSGR